MQIFVYLCHSALSVSKVATVGRFWVDGWVGGFAMMVPQIASRLEG